MITIWRSPDFKTLSYGEYNLAGELKKITDSTNMTINYGYDNAGRLNGVTGSDNLYAGVSNYASNFQYRAWGGLKAMTDGTNHVSSLLYNSKLQPSQFAISGNVVNQNYDYYNDGRISYVHNTTDVNFDRAYSYDHAGRITGATTGGIARGDSGSTPYHETFGYDALSNLTSRYTLSWGQDEFSDGAPYTNNRREGWGYDADGRNTTIDTRTYTFDAAGQTTLMTGQKWLINHYVATSQSAGYDGDGAKVKEVLSGVATYYLKSSVMRGAIIEELSSSGAKNVGYVYAAGGRLLARQSNNQVTWTHTTPAGTSKYDLYTGGTAGRVEFDPLGADVGIDAPQAPDTGGGQGDLGGVHTGGLMDSRYGNLANVAAGCTIDGMAASCSTAMTALNSGAGEECPDGECSRYNPNLRNGQGGIENFHAYADGYSGYQPSGSRYLGNGLVIAPYAVRPNSDPHAEFAGMVTLPQNSTQNPLALESKASVDCNLTVAFHGTYGNGTPNGPGEFSYGGYGQFHGLGFTVYGSVASGGIGRIGTDVNKDNPTGSWAIQQFTSAYIVANGVLDAKHKGGNAQPDLNTDSPYQVIGNQFRWYDHPGVQTRGLTSYQGKFDFTVKAVNGNKQCEIRFHALMTFSNGNWSVRWSQGGLPR